MAKALIAAVKGSTAAGVAELSLALPATSFWRREAAHFTAAYTAIALTPAGGMSWTPLGLVSMRVAQEMILANRRVSAAEAAALGLVIGQRFRLSFP